MQLGDFPEGLVTAGAVDGLVVAIPYDPRAETVANQRFVKQFADTFKAQPMQHSFNSYEGTRIVADAIARAGSTDPEALRKAMTTVRYRSALDAELTFDDHHQAYNNAVILGVVDRKVVVVSLMKP